MPTRETLRLPHSTTSSDTVPSRPVRLLAPHGYVRTFWSRQVRFDWLVGEVVSDPDEVRHLRERGASLEDA